MKYAFLALIGVFALMYVAAQSTLEQQGDPERTTIYWSTDKNPAREKQVALFEELYPDVQVIVQKHDHTKIIVRCATGTGADVVDNFSSFNMATWVEAGIMTDLTPYAAQMGFGLENTYQSLEGSLTVEGRQYRYPCNVVAAAVIYNKSILDDHGAPMPSADWTWEEFIDIALKVKNNPSKSGEKHIPLANWLSERLYQEMLINHGGRLFTEDGLFSALDQPAAIAAMKRFRRMALVDDIMPTSAEAKSLSSQGGWGTGGISWFFNQQAAMIVIGRWAIVRIPAYLKRNPGLDRNIASVVLPRVAGMPSMAAARSRAAGINSKTRHLPEALKFLQFLSSREYGRLIVKDGDSLPPNPALARTGASLVNEIIDDPAFHQPFIDAIDNARPLDLSPFIEAGIIERWLRQAVESVENGADPEEKMRQLAGEVNERIRLNLQRRPRLQERFERRTGRPYTADWWRHYSQV